MRNRGEWTFFGGTTTSVVKKCHFIQSSVGAGGVGGGGGGGVFTMSSSKQSGVRASERERGWPKWGVAQIGAKDKVWPGCASFRN